MDVTDYTESPLLGPMSGSLPRVQRRSGGSARLVAPTSPAPGDGAAGATREGGALAEAAVASPVLASVFAPAGGAGGAAGEARHGLGDRRLVRFGALVALSTSDSGTSGGLRSAGVPGGGGGGGARWWAVADGFSHVALMLAMDRFDGGGRSRCNSNSDTGEQKLPSPLRRPATAAAARPAPLHFASCVFEVVPAAQYAAVRACLRARALAPWVPTPIAA